MPLRKVRSEILGTRRLVHSRAYEYGKHRIRSFSFPCQKAAAEIGVDVRTVRTAIAEGQLPARQIGRRLMIPRRAIERLAEAE